MWGGCAERLTAAKPTRSSTLFAVSDIASVLLVETLRSSTFKLAAACIGLFGGAIFAIFGYVYWVTASYLRERADRTLASELALLGQRVRTRWDGEADRQHQ
jgi:hypothetical protein